MPEQFMRIGGSDGNYAKGIRTDRKGAIKNPTGVNFYDESVTSTLAGFHLFGETSGRGHKRILDISDYTDLMITVEVGGENDIGLDFLFFDTNNRVTQGNKPTNDPNLVYSYSYSREKGKPFPTNSKETFNSFEYSFLDVTNFQGMAILSINLPAGSSMRVKITGGM